MWDHLRSYEFKWDHLRSYEFKSIHVTRSYHARAAIARRIIVTIIIMMISITTLGLSAELSLLVRGKGATRELI